MSDKPLPGGWRASALPPHKLEEHLKYVARVTEELAAIPRIKKQGLTEWNGKPIENLTQEEREAFHFSQQPESTQQAILRQKERRPEDDNDYLLRPIPASYLAVPEAVTLAELTARREIEPEDALREKSLKTGRNQTGQSTHSSNSPERRERGIEAFTYSRPANPTDDELKRFKKLEPMEAIVAAEASKEEAPPVGWKERFRLKFNEIFGDWIY